VVSENIGQVGEAEDRRGKEGERRGSGRNEGGKFSMTKGRKLLKRINSPDNPKEVVDYHSFVLI